MADDINATFEHELKRLEQRVDALVKVCDQLQDPDMTDPYAQVSVRILDKEYQIACPASERTDLLDSAEILNAKMIEIRDSGRVVGLDRIAVMAALNMANDLIHAQARDRLLDGDLSGRLKIISERVENVLGSSQQLDL